MLVIVDSADEDQYHGIPLKAAKTKANVVVLHRLDAQAIANDRMKCL